jgi:hypothetical protein
LQSTPSGKSILYLPAENFTTQHHLLQSINCDYGNRLIATVAMAFGGAFRKEKPPRTSETNERVWIFRHGSSRSGQQKGFLGKVENGPVAGWPVSCRVVTVFLETDRSLDNQMAGTPDPFERPDVVPGRMNCNITSGTSPGCGTG